MSTGFTLADSAVAKHEDLKRQAIFAVNARMMTADQAFANYERQLIELLREARQEVDDDRMIQTRCADCKRVHSMPAHVMHYRCPCNPHQDRYPFNERVVLSAEET